MVAGLALSAGLVAVPAEASVTWASVTKVTASPARQTTDCPASVGFSAVVHLGGKGVVRYRWVRADGTQSAVKTITARGPKRVTVRDRQVFDGDAKGWQAVQILGARPVLSQKARFTVTCSGREPVYTPIRPLPEETPPERIRTAVSVKAAPSSYAGKCPAEVQFTTHLQVSRVPARVAYQWIDSAGGEGPIQYAIFTTSRSRTLSTTATVTKSTTGWKAVRVLRPHVTVSSRAVYAVTCDTGPVVATPSIDIGPFWNSGKCPMTVRFTGKVTVNKVPATVVYEWVNDQGVKGPSGTLSFTGQPGALAVTPYDYRTQVKGSVTLKILSPAAEPVTTWFGVICQDGNPVGAHGQVNEVEFAGNQADMCGPQRALRARGTVRAASGPATVTYEWMINGSPVGVTDSATSTGTDPWFQDVVTLGLQGHHAVSGSLALKIHNDGTISPTVNYGTTCADADHDIFVVHTVPDANPFCGNNAWVKNRAYFIANEFTGTADYQLIRKASDGQWQPTGAPTTVTFTGKPSERIFVNLPWPATQTEAGQFKLALTHGGQIYETTPLSYTVTCPA
ncbi:hypothetical protein [Streptosporangium sp. NPDC049046]|uniref:hypothetical protein n=1 Tax=Streptosporangium sp. NPDC049046 TaxID=3155031 RepID=UPI003419D26D